MRSLIVLLCILVLVLGYVKANDDSTVEPEFVPDADGVELVKGLPPIHWVKFSGRPKNNQVHIWETRNDHFVANSPMGIAIGNILKGTQLVIEYYDFREKTKADKEKALFGYGYIKKNVGNSKFGG